MIDIKLLNFKSVLLILSALGFCRVSSQMDARMYANITQQEEIMFMEVMSNFTADALLVLKDAQVSPKCKSAIKAYEGLSEMWAIKMKDASAKFPSGILDGNIFNLGAYDECQSITNIPIAMTSDADESETIELINGNYCLGNVLVPKEKPLIGIYWGVCVPDACNANDLNALATINKKPISFTESKCHSPAQDPEIDAGDIAAITFFGIIGGLMLFSSLYDYYLRKFEKKVCHPIFLAFSVVTNGEKLLSTKKTDDQMGCLSGIRFISMLWVILGHCFSNTAIMPITDINGFLKFYEAQWTRIVRAGPLAVDTFFLMTGVLIVYVYLKSMKNGQCFNIPMFYLHRYLRLTPALAVVLIVHLTILKHFGGGPYWDVMSLYCFDNCREYWWSTLLYLQNFVNDGATCIGQSWYLSCDMQLFLISPIFLLPLKRWPRSSVVFMAAAGMASMFASFGIAWETKMIDANAIFLLIENPDTDLVFNNQYYIQTYTRATPYFVGMIVGYYLYQIKLGGMKFRINFFLNLVLWVCSIAVLLTCVFYDNAKMKEYDQLKMASYIGFVRPAWSVGLAWIIFACVTGNGGLVNDMLSVPLFQILARFTYSMYLTHYTINLVINLSTKHPVPFSTARVFFDFWSVICLVFAVSVFWTLAFESPVLIIEKMIFGGRSGGNKQDVADKTVGDSREQIGTVINMDLQQDLQQVLQEKENRENTLHHRSVHGVTNNGYDDNDKC